MKIFTCRDASKRLVTQYHAALDIYKGIETIWVAVAMMTDLPIASSSAVADQSRV